MLTDTLAAPAVEVDAPFGLTDHQLATLTTLVVEYEDRLCISSGGIADEVALLARIVAVADLIRDAIRDPAYFVTAMGWKHDLGCDLASSLDFVLPSPDGDSE